MVHGLPAQEQSNGSILQNEVLHDLDVNNAPYIYIRNHAPCSRWKQDRLTTNLFTDDLKIKTTFQKNTNLINADVIEEEHR